MVYYYLPRLCKMFASYAWSGKAAWRLELPLKSKSYQLVVLPDHDVLSILLQVMPEAIAEHVLVADTEVLHERILHVVSLILQHGHQASVHSLGHGKEGWYLYSSMDTGLRYSMGHGKEGWYLYSSMDTRLRYTVWVTVRRDGTYSPAYTPGSDTQSGETVRTDGTYTPAYNVRLRYTVWVTVRRDGTYTPAYTPGNCHFNTSLHEL